MNRPEDALQIACVEFADRCVPPPQEGGPPWTAINPKPAKSKAAAGLSKAMGMKPGWPDKIWVWRGLFVIEFKSRTGRLSTDQKRVKAELVAHGVRWYECRSLAEFERIMIAEGVPMRGRLT